MSASGSKTLPAVGFLTVQSFADLGLIGGYLILNTLGRPLEFHCTAPVRPNRSQEILYGPTLAPYLYGEQIATTLISKGKSRPLFICTDVEPVLTARDFISLPLVLLEGSGSATEIGDRKGEQRIDPAHAALPAPKSRSLLRFQLAGHSAAVAEPRTQDRDEVLEHWRAAADIIDLLEPFSRLREAIDEAQRGAARALPA